MVERHLRCRMVQEVTGLSRSTIYALISKDEFPRPVKLTSKTVAWPESSIAEWLDGRKAA